MTSSQLRNDLSDLSVVVLSYNRIHELATFVPMLLNLSTMFDFELIVVDNNSTDGSRDFLQNQRWHGDCRLILSEENLGVAGGRNLGWSSAARDYILNLDDDTQPDIESMSSLVEYMRHNEQTGIAFPRVLNPLTGDNQTPYGESVDEPSNFHGACHIVRRQAYQEAGALDERCLFGGEELEYSIRMKKCGWKVHYIPMIVVYHHVLQHTGESGSWRRQQWVYNYVRILFKYFPWHRALIMASRVTARHLVLGFKTHGPATAPGVIRHAFRGARSGRAEIALLPPSLVNFYSSASRVPDIGNVPINRKIRHQWRARETKISREGGPTP